MGEDSLSKATPNSSPSIPIVLKVIMVLYCREFSVHMNERVIVWVCECVSVCACVRVCVCVCVCVCVHAHEHLCLHLHISITLCSNTVWQLFTSRVSRSFRHPTLLQASPCFLFPPVNNGWRGQGYRSKNQLDSIKSTGNSFNLPSSHSTLACTTSSPHSCKTKWHTHLMQTCTHTLKASSTYYMTVLFGLGDKLLT